MKWQEIRQQYPHQWLLVEALQAYSDAGKRILSQLSVVGIYPDSPTTMTSYTNIHRQSPSRELYVLHTDRTELDIRERQWLGIRVA